MHTLITRDLMITQRNNYPMLFLFVFVEVCLMSVSDSTLMPFYLTAAALLFAFMMMQWSFYCDEISGTNVLLRALPIAPQTLVRSRYTSCIICATIGMVSFIAFAFLLKGVTLLLPETKLTLNIAFDGGVLILCLSMSLVFCAVLLPPLFKFGYAKTRYPLMLLSMALRLLPFLLMGNSAMTFRSTAAALSFAPHQQVMLLILALLLLHTSLRLTTRIYAGKEI